MTDRKIDEDLFRKVIVRFLIYETNLVNHKMTKALKGLGVEVEIRTRYVDKLGHGFGVHLNMFLSHRYFIP